MNTVCTIIERNDGKREITYSKEEIPPSIFIRDKFYAILTNEKVEEIRNAKANEVQAILKTL